MKVFIGSDHAGYALKEALRDHLQQQGYEVEDIGVFSPEPADYPDVAHRLTACVIAEPGSRGILLCGTGIGMCIAANKRRGIRAAHAEEPLSAQLARTHNDANVLCLGGRILGIELAKAIVDTFLQTPFSAEERHARRVQKLELP
ncbi:Ribose-5-phosphate isomerase B [bacterium HR15]|nr:Ribose-5-phosphate isomerase B [bacterium HR15]